MPCWCTTLCARGWRIASSRCWRLAWLCPLVPFDAWPEFQQRHPRARPLPLTLAPNRMTDALSEAGGLPPLLEHPPTRQALIDLLVSLP